MAGRACGSWSICYSPWGMIFVAEGYEACWLVGWSVGGLSVSSRWLMVGWLNEWQAVGIKGWLGSGLDG